MPGDHVERRLADLGGVELAAPFDVKGRGLLAILVGGDRRVEVARIGEAVGADRPAVGQGEGAAVILAQIGPRRPVDQLDPEDDAALDQADLAGLDLDDAELGAEAQPAFLRHDQILAVGVEEILVAPWSA